MNTDKILVEIAVIRAARPDLYLGLRWHHSIEDCYEALSVGEIAPNSYQWDDGETTDEELSGTCAITIDASPNLYPNHSPLIALTEIKHYIFGEGQLMLLGSEYPPQGGVDRYEIVMSDPVVLAIFGLD